MNLPSDKIISCFYDSTDDCVKVLDTDANLMSFNPGGYEIMEIDNPKDVIGKDWLSFWKGEFKNKVEAAFNKAKSGEAAHFKGYCPTFKGNNKYWHVTIVPLKNEFNEVQWLLSISRDMTELKKLQDENRKLKARLSN